MRLRRWVRAAPVHERVAEMLDAVYDLIDFEDAA